MPKALFFHVNESPTASKKKNKTTAETPHGNTHKKAMRKDMAHPLSKRKLQKQKRQHSVRFPIHENPLFATAPVPACKYAILVSPEMTICHFESYATNYPPARGPSRLSLCLDTGWTKRTRRACRQMLPSGLLRGEPYFRSPLIGQPILANWQRI